tara:strand:- start:342 stop:770 length:429 start_codon:yes stop_codon:yes gene_type:complete
MAKCFNFASKADKRIEVYQKSRISDGAGGFDVSHVLQGTYWAYIEPLNAFEVFQSEQLKSKVTDKFIIRYQTAFKNTRVTAVYIIKFDGRYYDIKGIKNLDTDLKAEGLVYQQMKVVENDAFNDDDLNITDWENLNGTWETL